MYLFLIFIIGLTGFWNSVLAIEFPFTDVSSDKPYYTAVKNLYEKGILSSTETPTFKPDESLKLDLYTSILVGVGCKKCNTPSQEDILEFKNPPFPGISQDNPYYYCISYAQSSLSMTTYDSNTSISRIDATVALLKRANLWNEKLNTSNYKKDLKIIDVPSETDSLYGYAKKGIEIGLIKHNTDGSIGKNTIITRGEFALMAEKILKYTQCKTTETSSANGSIEIKDLTGGNFELVPSTGETSGDYSWEIVNQADGKKRFINTVNLKKSDIGVGSWIIKLIIKDKKTKKILSQPTININVSDTAFSPTAIRTDKLSTFLGDTLNFISSSSPDTNDEYSWDFGDRTHSNIKGQAKHAYTDPGIYTVTLTIFNTSTKITRQASIIVRISGDKDSDGDGLFDTSDTCPLVKGNQMNQGCPDISIFNYRDTVETLLGGGVTTIDSSSILNGIKRNSCLENKSRNGGMIFGLTPPCDTCPCASTVNIESVFRSCDIIFPAILSPNKANIYSRGGFYTIP
ncbi:S-layer homology domain-containing protein [Candidatus Gracilibacteria bacterium]|nr:S-layer homology domain-containing protein [Candidatus Gracilibacteria bacterium]